MLCKLCNKDVEKLCDSHIFPEFLYKYTYDDRHRSHEINLKGHVRLRQSGIKEKLLCSSCENILSKYESYFNNNFILKGYIPNVVEDGFIKVNIDNVILFKLFHLANLFRASISLSPIFSNVILGPHEDIIREILLNNSSSDNYCIFSSAIYNKHKNIVKGLVITPVKKKYKGHIIYQSVYTGCVWYVKISSHKCNDIDLISFNSNGEFYICADPMEELNELHIIKKSLEIHNEVNHSRCIPDKL